MPSPYTTPFANLSVPGSRRLAELDDLAPNDPERDEISKNLSDEEGDALMRRYGYTKIGGCWIHRDDR